MRTFVADSIRGDALAVGLERGDVAVLACAPFALHAPEKRFLSPEWSDDGAKNIALRAGESLPRGSRGSAGELAGLGAMMARYAQAAKALVDEQLPRYGAQPGTTSFRPCAIGARRLSWRRDDTRLHVDSFPSNPVKGRRILRVFTNIHPEGMTRDWNIGEPFAEFADRFFPRATAPIPGTARALRALGITKGVRSAYDHYMLRLHDLAKGDPAYQRNAPREEAAFAPGTTWIAFTDQVVHAAMRGQHALEQTFYVDVERMVDRRTSPLAVLERLAGRALA